MNSEMEANLSPMERMISRMEVFGLNAARLILAATITLAVFAFVIGLVGLAIEGVNYERKTNPIKYSVSSIAFTPHFSNVTLNGKAQADSDAPITVDRVIAVRKDRDQIVSDRLAVMREAGVCLGDADQCHDIEFQRKVLTDGFISNPATRAPEGSPISFVVPLSAIDLAAYYGSYGFSDEEGSARAEWEATTACLKAYKEKNGNLYISKSPILFLGIVAQCHYDYRAAIQSELAARPANWTLDDTMIAASLKFAVIACGSAIILIALTIIFFRLEVSFRSLRNLDRLRQ